MVLEKSHNDERWWVRAGYVWAIFWGGCSIGKIVQTFESCTIGFDIEKFDRGIPGLKKLWLILKKFLTAAADPKEKVFENLK